MVDKEVDKDRGYKNNYGIGIISILDKIVDENTSTFQAWKEKILAHYDRLSSKIVGQEEAVQRLLIGISRSLEDMPNRAPILVTGPTGCGKTYTIGLVAEELGVPFGKLALPSITPAGYKGDNIKDAFRGAIKSARVNAGGEDRTVLLVDEFDKVVRSGNYIPESGGAGGSFGTERQNELLALLEPDATLSPGEPLNAVIVLSGAFSFTDYDPQVGVSDESLRQAGFMSEMIGRISTRVVINALRLEDYVSMLKTPTPAIAAKISQVQQSTGLRITFDEEAIMTLARQSLESGLGARHLVSAIGGVMTKLDKELIFPAGNMGFEKKKDEIVIKSAFIPSRPTPPEEKKARRVGFT